MNKTLFTPEQFWTPEFQVNPHPTYHHFRDSSPLEYLFLPDGAVSGIKGDMREWAFMKYDDVYNAFRDHETFVSSRNPLYNILFPRLPLSHDDPPRHTHFRRMLNKFFTLKNIESLTPTIKNIANTLLDKITSREIDIMQSFAAAFPMIVTAHLLGIPAENFAAFRHWAGVFIIINSLSPEEQHKNNQEIMAFFNQIMEARRKRGADDMITAFVKAEVDGKPLEDWEIWGLCALLFVAGSETTTNLIGNTLNILAERPELWRQLRENRGLVNAVIEETLRYESPVQRIQRQTSREVVISGVKLPAKANISLFIGAANRDPRVFPDPDEFRLDRKSRNYLSFGAGIHACIGGLLARTETSIMLNALLDRFSNLQRGSEPTIRQTTSLLSCGFQQLPLLFR
ncbi:MAG: cytochrome P450 [Methylococcaceae bacterium]|nr:MAG: cytochrome P450 [Methylococcaceae bacterium]